MKTNGQTVEKPVSGQHAQGMLKRLYQDADKYAADVAAALKHWFPGDSSQIHPMMLDFMDWEPDNPEILAWWKTVRPSPEAAGRVREAATALGYTDAAIEAVKQSKAGHTENIQVYDYVEILKEKFKNIRCQHKQFFVYGDGIWKQMEWEYLVNQALNVLVHKDKDSKMAETVVSTLAADVYWPGQFKSAACFGDDDKTVLLNCRSGILKVTAAPDVERLPHSPEYNFCKRLRADYDPVAECKLFEDAVDVALPGEMDPDDPSKTTFADQDKLFWFGGWMLYPANPFKVALFCYGHGNTRKTTVIDKGFGSVFDQDEGTRMAVGLTEICDKKRYSLPGLLRSMVNFCGELNTLAIEDSSALKTIIAGEDIEGRLPNHPPVMFSGYSTKLVFMGNKPPMFRHGTSAEENRLEFLVFSNPVSPAADDKNYREKVSLERDGIFSRWMVPALQKLLAGEKMPSGSSETVRHKQLFCHGNSPVVAFAKERLDMDPDANQDDWLERDDAEGAMKAFCEDHGYSEKLVASIWQELQKQCGLEAKRPTVKGDDGKRTWLPFMLRGARLKSTARIVKWTPRDGRRKTREDSDQ